jgi:hypothetical protein
LDNPRELSELCDLLVTRSVALPALPATNFLSIDEEDSEYYIRPARQKQKESVV